MSHIIDFLYIGSIDNANDQDFLIKNNIKTVINLTFDMKNTEYDYIKYYYVPVQDNPFQPMLHVFSITNKIINDNKQYGNILVHCYVGKSRSVSCVIAYLIYKYNYTLNQSLEFIRKKRPIIAPNYGFVIQLQEYEKNIYKNKYIVVILLFFLIYIIIKYINQ